MKNKYTAVFMAFFMLFAFATPSVFAAGFKEAGASLLLPTTGQGINGEFGTTKTKIMAGVEVAAITTVVVLGTTVGGPVVWAGLGPLLANHAWSSLDAYRGAQKKQDPLVQQQMMDAQRTLELSRQRRFEREETRRSDLRSRMAQAGQLAS